MMDYRNSLAVLVAESESMNQVLPPDSLFDRLDAIGFDSLLAADGRSINQLYEFLENEYSYILDIRYQREEGDEQCKSKAIMLISWLIDGLKSWDKSNDSKGQTLLAILLVANYLDYDGSFWATLPCDFKLSSAICEASSRLITCVESRISGEKNAPIHEKESSRKFEKAIASGDWFVISELWRAFENGCRANLFIIQMVKLLAKFAHQKLAEGFLNYQDIPMLMLAMRALSREQVLLLAAECDNSYVEFSAVFSVHPRSVGIGSAGEREAALLATILHKVAKNSVSFEKWMRVFNQYPTRYPFFHRGLGLFLAQTEDEKAVEAYINSIKLHFSDHGGRELVSKCLGFFSCSANLRWRKLLWSKAYKRWQEWNFGLSTYRKNLFEIGTSELDFALVGYFIECITTSVRVDYQRGIVNQLAMINNQWHRSATQYNTYRNRLLSQLQPVAHALHVDNTDAPWLMEGITHVPEQWGECKYSDIMFGV